jgi:hypothetical protein
MTDFPALYVCEHCGRLAPIRGFENVGSECRPGWTHGRLYRVETIALPEETQAIIDRLKEAPADVA